jgi:hypothetical protein
MRAAVYEEFMRAVETSVAVAPATARGLVSGAITPETVRVYVMSAEAAAVVEQATERLRAIPLFEPPVPCVWIEFEGDQMALTSGEIVRAITVHPARQVAGADTHYEVRCWPAPGMCTSATIVSPTVWFSDVSSCPERAACPLAAARSTGLSNGSTDWLSARQALPNVEVCACARSATRMFAYVATLLTLLRADGVDHEEHLTPPGEWRGTAARQATSGSKAAPAAGATRSQGSEGGDAPIRWVRISLSQQRPWPRAARSAVDDEDSDEVENDSGEDRGDVHLTQVATHPRLLIPGPDKPWRGDTPRVVWVRTHQRHVHGRSVARYYVEP